MEKLSVERDALMFDGYELPLPASFDWSTAATSLAGILGTFVVFGIAIALGKATRWTLIGLTTEGSHAS